MEPQTTPPWEGDKPPPHLTPLERLPQELLLNICSFLPIESHVALAMTSRTMEWKLGQTFWIDDVHDEDEEMLREKEAEAVTKQNKNDNSKSEGGLMEGYADWWDKNKEGWEEYKFRGGEVNGNNNPDDSHDNGGGDGGGGDDSNDGGGGSRPHPQGLVLMPPTPHMSLLELLERETLKKLCTRCGYCRIIHPAICPVDNENKAWRLCRHTNNRTHWLDDTITISLPLVRTAVLLAERDVSDGSQLDSILAGLCRTTATELPATDLRYLIDHQARVVNGCVMLRKQVFIPYKGRRGTSLNPSARDLAALDYILSWAAAGKRLPVPPLGLYLEGLCCMQTVEYVPPDAPEYCMYRDDIGPTPKMLDRRLQCLLTHPMPCLQCAKKDDPLGGVEGDWDMFVDQSINTVPLPGNPRGRVLVFTVWINIGAGEWPGDVRWLARPGPFEDVTRLYRYSIGGRPGDIYEAYEGTSEGSPYIPPLLPHIVEQLHPGGGKGKGKMVVKP